MLPRHFEIEFNKNFKGLMILQLLVFHEMCHVEQWSRGIHCLILIKKVNVVVIVSYIYENHPYTKQPWERQVHIEKTRSCFETLEKV